MDMLMSHEEFTSISELIETINGRRNNRAMQGEHSSDKEDSEFSMSKSLAHAEEMLQKGWTEHLDSIKTAVRKSNRELYNLFKTKRLPANMTVGFVPNVPNALQNLPDSMINIQQTFQKKKTKHVIYVPSSNCSTDAEVFVKAGISIVTAISLLEAAGIQTKLSVAFFAAACHDDELAVTTLQIKNYGERFNLEKICFPMIHPAMFRRIGFKWLETYPKLKSRSFAHGYGHTPSCEDKEQIAKMYQRNDEDTVILWVNDIRDNRYDTNWILDQFGFAVPEKVKIAV